MHRHAQRALALERALRVARPGVSIERRIPHEDVLRRRDTAHSMSSRPSAPSRAKGPAPRRACRRDATARHRAQTRNHMKTKLAPRYARGAWLVPFNEQA